MNTLLAILQPPEPESFAMVPLVWRENGKLRVTGFSRDSAHRADGFVYGQSALDVLIANGSARAVPKMGVDAVADDFVGFWVGDVFRLACRSAGLRAPEPGPLSVHDGFGTFSVDASPIVFAKMDAWVEYAFAGFLRASSAGARVQIAELMHWALPGDERTLASLWSVSADPAQELRLQTSVFRRGQTPEAWEATLRRVIEKRVVAAALP